GPWWFTRSFFSPLIAAVLSLLLLRFLAREANPRVGFWVVMTAAATPLLTVGSNLMTIDPLSVLFWSGAMISGWYAVQRDSTRLWLWTGLWMGFGFLSKYTALLQWICWAVFFILWKPSRVQLRRKGLYLALAINLVCALPVLVWNYQHGWITVIHVASDGGWGQAWRPTLRYAFDFIGSEFGLLNPVFFAAAVWAAIAFWRRHPANPLLVYLFSMGWPLFLFYGLYTLRSRVLPNWIAPSVLPMFCLMVIYWESRWRAGQARVRTWLAVGLTIGMAAVVLLHDTDLVEKIIGRPLPVKLDPLRRVRAWAETARVVDEARTRLLGEGKPVFIIGDHYGITGELAFYVPAAKAGIVTNQWVFYQSSARPDNQFFFWPGYQRRKGQNAIFVQQTDQPQPPPARLQNEFASVTPCPPDDGMRSVLYHGRVFRRFQLFECRDLR
ncbi:MAG: glycosyltransferase family 39 protein, partial [Candidatus Omnitrophica bacterium]|nr:glycosyltransferase family 39 protein [Candidatus Omnitrophota bacterium]